jgi:hypothetical protein
VRRPSTAGEPPAEAGRSESAPSSRGIGAWLARQRRLRGISLDELESLTRVPRRSLERLEAGVYDASPDGFARGFVRTVASAIGLDPDDAVARMLSEVVLPPARRRSRAVPVLLLLAALLGLGGLVVLAAGLVPIPRGLGLPGPAGAPGEVRRRDFVSELAADVAAGRIAVPVRPPPAEPEPAPAAGTEAAPESAPIPAPEAAPAADASAAEPVPGVEPLASRGDVAPH